MITETQADVFLPLPPELMEHEPGDQPRGYCKCGDAGVSPVNHDHVWHQTSTLLVLLLGYLVGLILSLEDDLRPLLPWLRIHQRKSELQVH